MEPPNPPSLQADDVLAAMKELAGKKSLSGLTKSQEGLVERWQRVFANRIALSLSFRKHIGKIIPEFLRPSADFDYDALDLLCEICKKCEPFHQRLLKTLVSFFFCLRCRSEKPKTKKVVNVG